MNTLLPGNAEARRFTRADWLFLAALIGLTVLVAQWQAHSKSLLDSRFLNTDEGESLLVADVLAHGGKLYTDVTYPYGYLPAWLHASAVRLFGNSITTYLHYFLVLNVAAFALLYAVVRKIFVPWAAFLFVGLVMLPEMIAPGALCGGNTSNAAYPLEPIFMLAIVLLWREPGRQHWRPALGIGLCLGTMQGVKFGTGLVLGVSLAIMEVLCWYQTGFDAGVGRRLVRNNLVVFGGFLLMEGLWVAVTLASVPPAYAHDLLWPLHMYQNYASFPEEFRRPHWENPGYFIGVQMVPCIGAAASLWWLGARLFRRGDPVAASAGSPSIYSLTNLGSIDGILILPLFYLLGSLVLFKNVWLYHSLAWILTLGAVYLLIQPRRIIRWTALALWAGNLLLFVRPAFDGSQHSLVAVTLDSGDQIWVSPDQRAEITGIVDYLHTASARDGGKARPVVFYPVGGGFHPLFHIPYGGRPSWFMVGLLRPYDDPAVARLARCARWVVRATNLGDPASPDPAVWDAHSGVFGSSFDPSSRAEIASQLVCEKFIAPDYYVFTQREPGAGSAHPEVGAAKSPFRVDFSP